MGLLRRNNYAVRFITDNLIEKVNEVDLSAMSYRSHASNLLCVLDRYIPPLVRKSQRNQQEL